jgi:LysM repeat protein
MAVPPAGYGAATWSLDPAYPYSAGATELHILVEEWSCHGMLSAEGRIAQNIQYRDQAVVVTLAVRSPSGFQTCPAPPPTPHVLHLGQPVGDRDLLDGGLWPANAIARGGQPVVSPTPTPRPYVHYTAQAEDSLASIAARLHFDPAEITAANPSIDANHLTAGQVVNVPIGHWPSDCGGTDYGNFFKFAGMSVKFALFCAAVPDGWTVKSSTLSQDSSLVRVVYAGPNGEAFTLAEGAIDQADYPPTAATTALPLPEFGDKVGWLETVGGQHWCLVPEAPVYWVTIGQGMSLEEFTTLTRALIRVAT